MTILEVIAKYWHLWLSLVGIMATWFAMQNVDKDHERRIASLEAKTEAMNEKFDPVLVEIKERLAAIETALKFLTKQND